MSPSVSRSFANADSDLDVHDRPASAHLLDGGVLLFRDELADAADEFASFEQRRRFPHGFGDAGCRFTFAIADGKQQFHHARTPHPGNLLLTRDGRIALLDFGMITRVSVETGIVSELRG